jgi:predicted transposase/invertase (TIGR01784 family)
MTDKSLGTFINPFTDNSLRNIYAQANFKLNELANMNYEDRHTYELSLKYYRDFVNVLDTAKKEGIELGIDLRNQQVALSMLQKNLDINLIAEVTGLSKQILENLKSHTTV